MYLYVTYIHIYLSFSRIYATLYIMAYNKDDYTSDAKRKRFERLAALRTNSILNRLEVLGNCSNKHLYQYEKQDIEKIFEALEEKTKLIKAKFLGRKREEFKF